MYLTITKQHKNKAGRCTNSGDYKNVRLGALGQQVRARGVEGLRRNMGTMK